MLRARRAVWLLVALAAVGAAPASAADGRAVPATFRAADVAGLTARSWVAVGSVPCRGRRLCVAVARTDDAGARWTLAPAPAAPFASTTPAAEAAGRVTFADPLNGWVYGGGLWSTHDGGRTWSQVILPSGVVTAAAAASGRVHLLVEECNTAGGMCQFGRVLSSPVERDRFAPDPVPRLGFGGGSFDGALVTAGAAVVYTAFVSTGTRSRSSLFVRAEGSWERRPAPCSGSFGTPLVAGASAGRLVAVCGDEPGAGNQRKHAFRSRDGGRRWTRLPPPPTPGYARTIAVTQAGAILLANGRGELDRSGDGGRTWTPVLGNGAGDGWSTVVLGPGRVAFALPYGLDARDRVVVSTDGGATWRTTRFRR